MSKGDLRGKIRVQCWCGNDAQKNKALREQCERKLIDGQKPTWAVKERDDVKANRQDSHLPDVQTDDAH
jgi:hypothetical protein